jgi:hypothetical protein
MCGSIRRTAAAVLGSNVQLIDVWVENAVHEAYARTLVRILIWQLDVDLPESASEWCCVSSQPLGAHRRYRRQLTLFGTFEADIELLPVQASV